MNRLVPLLIAALSLGGCETPYGPVEHDEDEARCKASGYQSGQPFTDCMQFLFTQRDVQARNNRLLGTPVIVPTYSPPPAYRGNCPTPDSLDSRGRRCGKRAASYRPGG